MFDVTILEVQENALKVKAKNGSASLGGEDIDVAIQNRFLDETRLKLSSEAKNQETEDFIMRVKGDLAALVKLRACG